MGALGRRERLTLALALGVSVAGVVLSQAGADAVLVFAVSGLALALLASLVGQATEQLGERLGPGATGVLQSALGNLPELFFGIFALRLGKVAVVQATIVGSILGNSLLVLGLAFLVGGLRHGTQRFDSQTPRMIATLTALAVAALAVPTLARGLHTAAGDHTEALSIACAIVLLIVFVASIPFSLSGGTGGVPAPEQETETAHWPLALAAGILLASGVGAAVVSDVFVNALTPATKALHISEVFTGLVIVAIAGNAVENVVGIQLAARNKPDYAISVILNSSLQVALGLTPILVLASFVVGSTHLTLALPGLLVGALGLTAALGALIVYDGESTWLEGVALIGLYCIIAASFWWG
jgi:Ca2+:H+ antiporter